MPESPSIWNSLEVLKLIVSILTPAIIGILGVRFNRRLKELEHRQWTSQKVIEKRIQVYDSLVPHLNGIMCYFTYIGEWKDLTPPEVLKIKREADKIAHINAPLFPDDFIDSYNRFIEAGFRMFGKFGQDAKLRTDFQNRMPLLGEKWQTEWEQLFCEPDQITDRGEVRRLYNQTVAYMAKALDLGLGSAPR
ncbi:MAG TPA: hypothetical protein PKV71_17550 [Calditrichia bacterium]|nr:hypothetical protein [Calditrichota bacterium]HQU74847.1 hypothetical protein [Calditrichia bacterium]HQV33695.1 hypothetical protein [Calditrichia bacterium]